MEKKLRYHLTTFGCQMNKNDSERAESLLVDLGLERALRPEEADFLLVNTCSVRQAAEDRVFGLLHLFAKLKEKRPDILIGVTGCMAGRDKDGRLRAKLPMADFFLGTVELPQLPRLLAEHWPDFLEAPAPQANYLSIAPYRPGAKQAYVTVQTGCSKFCSYCVVPYARGLEKNRPLREILDEIRSLAAAGCLEVTLLGQAVNAYRASDPENFSAANPFRDHFAALLWEINEIKGIERFHYTAPHPLHLSEEGIEALALKKHIRFLHLPVQSGSNEILRRMNRRYTREQYLDLIERARARVPELALGTDIIVGFSGETAEQFEETVDLYRLAAFDIAYLAQYSARSGTLASRAFKDDVPREEKKRRWRVLQNLMEEIVLQKNKKLIGQSVRVLVCDVDSRGFAEGNSDQMKRVRFLCPPDQSDSLVGKLVWVRIQNTREWVLDGVLERELL